MAASATFQWNAFDIPSFSGDSLTEGGIAGAGGTSVSYRTPLIGNVNAAFTASRSCRVVNTGLPASWYVFGYTATQMDKWASTAVSDTVGKGINISFVRWGRNDASAGTDPLVTKANLKTGCNAVWDVEPLRRFVIIGPQNNGELWPQGAGSLDAAMATTFAGIQAGADDLSARGAICCLDPTVWWFGAGGIPLYNPSNLPNTTFLTVDGLHENAIGAQMDANWVWSKRAA